MTAHGLRRVNRGGSLILASFTGNSRCVEVLLSHGVDTEAKDAYIRLCIMHCYWHRARERVSIRGGCYTMALASIQRTRLAMQR